MHPRILDRTKTALVVVDVQEAFRNVVDESSIVQRIIVAIQGFQILERPVFVTEQYPKGLGRTINEIQSVALFLRGKIGLGAITTQFGESFLQNLLSRNGSF